MAPAPRPSSPPSPRRHEIVEVAGRLLDERGPEAVSMRNIAAEMGIKAPSLYKHVADKRELELALIADALAETADVLGAAVVGRARPRWPTSPGRTGPGRSPTPTATA